MRIKHWERLLDEFIISAPQFQWGQHDCALWCADWIVKCTGRDLTSDWRGLYHDEPMLQSLLKEKGFESISGIADAALKRINVNFAQRGDVLLHPQGALGICNGIFTHFLMEKGVTKLSTFRCETAWKVS